jgi:hypothetical protein
MTLGQLAAGLQEYDATREGLVSARSGVGGRTHTSQGIAPLVERWGPPAKHGDKRHLFSSHQKRDRISKTMVTRWGQSVPTFHQPFEPQ